MSVLWVGLIAMLFLVRMVRQHRRRASFNRRLIQASLLGIVLGGILTFFPCHGSLFEQALLVISGAYLGLLRMLVIPLILFSIISALLKVSETANTQGLSTLAFRSIGLLLLMTSVSAGIALLVGNYFQVGEGLVLGGADYQPRHVYVSLSDTLLGMLPSNPIAAMAEQNTIAMLILAVLIGLAGMLLSKTDAVPAQAFKQWVESVFAIVKQMTRLVMAFTPYGVFALLAQLVVDNGLMTFHALGVYILAMFVAMVLVVLLIQLPLLALRGYSPIAYFKRAYTPLLVALTTRSSFATLPITEETLKTHFRLPQLTASFVPSIGATIGMSACAGIFPAMIVSMTMHALHQSMDIGVFIEVMGVCALSSLGISGIPGTASIAASAALNMLGLPYFMLGVVQSVDPLVDMGRTAVNVSGVITASVVSNKSR